MDEDIKRCDRLTREANMAAMMSQGFRRWTHLKFASLFSWLGDIGRQIQQDEHRGKDDKYHDEY